MARLTLNQAELKIKREKAKQEAIRQKMEIQKKIELYGENWKVIEQQKILGDIEKEIGGDKTPKIYDSKDLYDFFDPIAFYKDENNNSLKLDFEKYSQTLNQYKSALLKANQEVIKANKANSADLSANSVNEDKEDNEDETEFDNDHPIEKEDLDEKQQLINKEKRDTVAGRTKGKLAQIVSTYFHRFVPLYNKHVCTCCGVPKQLNDYYVVYNITCSDRVDDNGSFHMWVCKECVNRLFAYFYGVLADKNVELAMQYLCASLNWYWDVDYFYQAKKIFEDNDRKGTIVSAYVSEINRSAIGKTFMDSPFIVDEQYNSANRIVTENPDEAPFDWSQEDAKNKKTVLKMVGYDPFEHEEEEDKKILYRDFLNILDEGMENDYVKFQAGIQIVQSFYKIRKMNERLSQMEKDDAPLRDQKDLADLKAKELKSITDFSRDNGFSERYATAKARGENTLTGIMNKMNEQKYEKAIMNRYDIATSETIQQAADASIKAIFSQLSLGDSEIWKITQDQLEEIRKLRKELDVTTEDLRKAKYELAELRLQERARKESHPEESEGEY